MTLLLVAGPPASGKTAASHWLRDGLGWPLLSKDAVKEILFDTVGFTSRQEKIVLNGAAMGMLCHAADAVLASGCSMILESNFETRDIPALEAVCARHAPRVITVRMEASIDTLYRRYCAREEQPGRHLGHKHNDAYPPIEGSVPPPADREALVAGIQSRGMDTFAQGTLIRCNTEAAPEAYLPGLLEAVRAQGVV